MLRDFLTFASLILSVSVSVANETAESSLASDSLSLTVIEEGTHPLDTLLNVSNARNLKIYATSSSTSITVRGLEQTSDNFYYRTETRNPTGSNSTICIENNDVKDVVVRETGKEVNISYLDSEGTAKGYGFQFLDPGNRSQASYIGEKWSDFSINLGSKNKTRWDIVSCGLSIGWVTPLKPSPDFHASMGRSVELSWLMTLGVRMIHRSFSVAVGVGLDWRNFVTKGDRYFQKDLSGQITMEPYTDVMAERRSRIKIFSLQVPLLMSVRFGHNRHWGISGGPIVNFNTSASLKTQFKYSDEYYSIKTTDIGQRPVTVDAYLAVDYRGIGLYARYSPMNLMKKSTGLDFGGFSTGLAFLF